MFTKVVLGAFVLAGLGVGLRMVISTASLQQVAAVSEQPRTTATMMQTSVPLEQYIETLSPEEFAVLVTSDNYMLLDVRTPEEYTEGHLPGAGLVDFNAPDFLEQVVTLPKNEAYALYCRSGNRSGQTRQLLAQAGFARVVDLAGGVKAWEASGRTLCTDC